MKTAAEFYEIFRRHGFLTAATHVAQNGPQTQTPLDVEWAEPGQLIGDDISSSAYAVTFPRSMLPGLRAGDRMLIAGKTYAVRNAIGKPGTDGSEWLAELQLLGQP